MNIAEFPWLDFLLNVGVLAVVPGIVALIGGYLAAKSLPDAEFKLKRRTKLWFSALFVVGVAMTAWQQYRVVLTEQGKPNSSVDAFKQAFPWFKQPEPPQAIKPTITQKGITVPSKETKTTFSLTDEANIRDLPAGILSGKLHAAADGLKDDWLLYWDGEDGQLEKQVGLLQQDEPKNRRAIQQVQEQRKQLRIVFNDQYINRIRSIGIIVFAAQDRVAGTKEDRDMRTIIAGIMAGSLRDDNASRLGDLVNYLNGLADRVAALPTAK